MGNDGVPPEFVGREASCRVVGPLLDAAEKRGVTAAVLVQGTGYTLAHLRNARERIAWTAFMRFLENIGRELDDDTLVAIGRTQLDRAVHRAVLLPGRLLFSLRDIFVWGVAPNGPIAQANAAQEMTCAVLDDRHLRIDVAIKPGYTCRREFWLIRRGFFESVPRSFGHPFATVDLSEMTDTGARYDVTLPDSEGLVSRAKERMSWVFATREAAAELRKANEDLHRRQIELESEVAARKAAEADLRELNAELERHVADRTRELELLTHSVVHDLRTPLRAINGFATSIIEDHGPALGDDAKHGLARVAHAAVRIGLLLDSLLSLSRIGRAELKRETVDLAKLGGHVIAELERLEPDREVEVAFAGALETTGDAALLKLLLGSLLENAWRFTRERRPARIEVTRIGDAFCVRDNGIGFAMDHGKPLFERFHRAHAPKSFDGLGTGLAIADRIVQRHGGRIWVETAPNEGASFYFTLPVD